MPSVIYDFSRDAQGTPVVADLGALRASRYVVVALDSAADGTIRKTYVAGSEELSDDEAAAHKM